MLTKAGLWNEVKDRLGELGGGLSGGQQQRLCIARALAVRPRVLLMDEPCSALDPTSTNRIEETIREIADEVTVVIVTHNMQQAQRVSHTCAFFLAGRGPAGPCHRIRRHTHNVHEPNRPTDKRLRQREVRMRFHAVGWRAFSLLSPSGRRRHFRLGSLGAGVGGRTHPQLTSTGSSFAGVAISQWQGQFNEVDGGTSTLPSRAPFSG